MVLNTYESNSKDNNDSASSNFDENKSSLPDGTPSVSSEKVSSLIDEENKSEDQNIGFSQNSKSNTASNEESNSVTMSSNPAHQVIVQLEDFEEDKNDQSSVEEEKDDKSNVDLDMSETQSNGSGSNPITLLNKQNRKRIAKSYQESMKSYLETKKIQEVPLATVDEYDYVIYQPEMISYEDLERHFKMTKSEYDRITQTCKLLDQLLGQKIEFQIFSYDKDSIFWTVIHDMNKSDLRYFYKGCIDMEKYKEKKVIIPHGPGTRYKSTGQLQQGMF